MKVDFQTRSVNQNVDVEQISKGTASSAGKADTKGGYKVDISGTVMDNAAYGTGELKTAQEIMQDAGGQQDVALQRNYMAVMSNSMSTEDFAKLQEEGFRPGSSTKIETAVTVLDEIKAALADAGIVIEGFTDDLSAEQLEAITGNTGRAMAIEVKLKEKDLPVTKDNVRAVERALELAGNMTRLSDGAVKYLIQNDLEPTIDNVYKAEYSSTGSNDEVKRQAKGYYLDEGSRYSGNGNSAKGYYAKKADSSDIDWNQLKGQIEKIIQDAGFSVDEETIENSKWLIEKGIPLTGNTLAKLTELRTVSLPMQQDDILNAVLSAIADGKEAKNAILSEGGDKSIVEHALELKQRVEKLTNDNVRAVVEQGEELTINNLLKSAGNVGNASDAGNAAIVTDSKTRASYEMVAAQRNLEEIRLRMTVEANTRLLRSGFSIETEELERVVEALKETEKAYYQTLFEDHAENTDQNKIALYKETTVALYQIKSLPAAVLGKISTTGNTFTLSHVQAEGMMMKAAYEKAGQTYETLGTAPRSDLGDSIQKAFRNVDSLLKGMGMETTDANRRAARILGYNRMEITQESVAVVKEADQAVRRLMEKMTPAVTINLIRKGNNPMETPIYELVDALSMSSSQETEQEATAVSKQAEKYSEYLWKLEKSNGITAEERAAYIGIYRLFHQIEKNDSSVIGSVIQQYENADTALTLKNLLSAARTGSRNGNNNASNSINIGIDSEFGMLEELKQTETIISEQIEAGFQRSKEQSGEQFEKKDESRYAKALANEILDHLSPDKLQNMKISMNTTIEEFAEKLRDAEESGVLREEYLNEQMQDIQRAKASEDYVIQTLIDFDQPVTVDYLLAESALLNNRGGAFRQLFEQAARRDVREGTKFSEELNESVSQLQEGLSEEETAKKAYENLQKMSEKILDIGETSQIRSVDVRAMNTLYKQITLATNLSKEENYEIPVMIGDEWTSINLKIIKNSSRDVNVNNNDIDKTDGFGSTISIGKVTATMEMEGIGMVAAEFQLKQISKNNEGETTILSGIIACNSSNGINALSRNEEIFKEVLGAKDSGIQVGELHFIQSKELDIQKFGMDTERTERTESTENTERTASVSAKELYQVAKAFITVMKGVTKS